MRFGNNKLNRILAVALCAATLTGGFLPTVSVEAAVRSGQHSEVRQGRGDNQQHKRTDPGNKNGHTAPAQKIIKTVSRAGRRRISTGMTRIDSRSSSARNMSSVSVRSRKSIVRRK